MRTATMEKESANKLVAVAIDRDRGSQNALKWAIDNLLSSDQTVVLVHVKVKPISYFFSRPHDKHGSAAGDDPQIKELFVPFRCFCRRKDIHSHEVVLEDTDVIKALIEFVTQSAIDVLVLGAHTKHGFLRRLKATDVPAGVSKGIPDFCTAYVISRGRISSTRSASRPAPAVSPLRNQLLHQASIRSSHSGTSLSSYFSTQEATKPPSELLQSNKHKDTGFTKSPFSSRKGPGGKSYGELSPLDVDISYVSSGRSSRLPDQLSSCYDSFENISQSRSSDLDNNNNSFESLPSGCRSVGTATPPPEFSFTSHDSGASSPSQTTEDMEHEMTMLKQELKQRMDMYSIACKLKTKDKGTESDMTRLKQELKGRMDIYSTVRNEKIKQEDAESEMRRLKQELKERMDMYNTVYKEKIKEDDTESEMRRLKQELKGRMDTYSTIRQEKTKEEGIEFEMRKLKQELRGTMDMCSTVRKEKTKEEDTESAMMRLKQELKGRMDMYSTVHKEKIKEEDIESEMRRLKQELKARMDMYNIVCKEKTKKDDIESEMRRLKQELNQRMEMHSVRKEKTKEEDTESEMRGLKQEIRRKMNLYSTMNKERGKDEDAESEMRRLKLELKQTMNMYSTACKEALSAQEKANELQRWKMDEQPRLEEARLAEQAALVIVETERAKSRAAIEAAEAAQRIAELESQKRINAEMKALNAAGETSTVLKKMAQSHVRYRKYTIEEIEDATKFFSESHKVGEGGYGPVFKCYLDQTPVAVKVLRPNVVCGRSQFEHEVEILSCIRHPNIVLLLGACPEYGCLVYEYMNNGSLEDCLLRRGHGPPLSWQHRFRIAAEIASALLFLHQNKPEPLVHRDLKPANILLDRNYVSKISDVGVARIIHPSVADDVTQYQMTSTAGTFCYIDPEYQRTGTLCVKSDIYSLGIMFLQMITAKPPKGLADNVERAIENGSFAEMLDPTVPDWPFEETLSFAKLSLNCAELRRRDRPNLNKEVMPELERLRELAEGSLLRSMFDGIEGSINHSQVSLNQDELSYPSPAQSGYASSGSRFSMDA